MNNGQRRSNPNEIGAAWIKQGNRNGEEFEYISIQLKPESANFDLANCFIDMYWNASKTNPKAPDYRIVAKPKQSRQQAAPPQRQAMPRPGRPQPQQRPPAGGNPGYVTNFDDGDPEF